MSRKFSEKWLSQSHIGTRVSSKPKAYVSVNFLPDFVDKTKV
jgi:hypothetical protein